MNPEWVPDSPAPCTPAQTPPAASDRVLQALEALQDIEPGAPQLPIDSQKVSSFFTVQPLPGRAHLGPPYHGKTPIVAFLTPPSLDQGVNKRQIVPIQDDEPIPHAAISWWLADQITRPLLNTVTGRYAFARAFPELCRWNFQMDEILTDAVKPSPPDAPPETPKLNDPASRLRHRQHILHNLIVQRFDKFISLLEAIRPEIQVKTKLHELCYAAFIDNSLHWNYEVVTPEKLASFDTVIRSVDHKMKLEYATLPNTDSKVNLILQVEINPGSPIAYEVRCMRHNFDGRKLPSYERFLQATALIQNARSPRSCDEGYPRGLTPFRFNIRIQGAKTDVDLLQVNLGPPEEWDQFECLLAQILRNDRDYALEGRWSLISILSFPVSRTVEYTENEAIQAYLVQVQLAAGIALEDVSPMCDPERIEWEIRTGQRPPARRPSQVNMDKDGKMTVPYIPPVRFHGTLEPLPNDPWFHGGRRPYNEVTLPENPEGVRPDHVGESNVAINIRIIEDGIRQVHNFVVDGIGSPYYLPNTGYLHASHTFQSISRSIIKGLQHGAARAHAQSTGANPEAGVTEARAAGFYPTPTRTVWHYADPSQISANNYWARCSHRYRVEIVAEQQVICAQKNAGRAYQAFLGALSDPDALQCLWVAFVTWHNATLRHYQMCLNQRDAAIQKQVDAKVALSHAVSNNPANYNIANVNYMMCASAMAWDTLKWSRVLESYGKMATTMAKCITNALGKVAKAGITLPDDDLNGIPNFVPPSKMVEAATAKSALILKSVHANRSINAKSIAEVQGWCASIGAQPGERFCPWHQIYSVSPNK